MAKRGEVWKNVSSTTTQDIKLNCTVESLKAVADNMDVIKRNLTDEMPEKPERNKEKTEEEDTFTFYWWHPNPAKRGFKNKDDNCYLSKE